MYSTIRKAPLFKKFGPKKPKLTDQVVHQVRWVRSSRNRYINAGWNFFKSGLFTGTSNGFFTELFCADSIATAIEELSITENFWHFGLWNNMLTRFGKKFKYISSLVWAVFYAIGANLKIIIVKWLWNNQLQLVSHWGLRWGQFFCTKTYQLSWNTINSQSSLRIPVLKSVESQGSSITTKHWKDFRLVNE